MHGEARAKIALLVVHDQLTTWLAVQSEAAPHERAPPGTFHAVTNLYADRVHNYCVLPLCGVDLPPAGVTIPGTAQKHGGK